jgi:hypothetical protein
MAMLQPVSRWKWLAARPAFAAGAVGLLLGAAITFGAMTLVQQRSMEHPDGVAVVEIFTGRVLNVSLDGAIVVTDDNGGAKRSGGVYRLGAAAPSGQDINPEVGDHLRLAVLRVQIGPSTWIDQFVALARL